MSDADRGWISQYSQEDVGISITVGSVPADADGDVTVTVVNEDTQATLLNRPAAHVGTGLYQITLAPDDTAVLGNYRASWSYLLSTAQKTFQSYFAVGGAEPAYDALSVDLKAVVDRVWIRMCVDTETEALTRQGWRSYDQFEPDDELLTLNHETGLSEWLPIQGLLVIPVEKEPMLSIESTVHSSLTTMDHKWPVLHTRRKTFRDEGRTTSRVIGADRVWRMSRQLNSNDRIITAAPCGQLPTEPKWSDAFVELVAWFWTEGTAQVRLKRRHPKVSISQSHTVHPEYVVRIRKALTTLFGPGVASMDDTARWRDRTRCHPLWSERKITDRTETKFYLNQEAARELLEVAPDKIVSLDFIQALTEPQLLLFLKISVCADGWITEGGSHQITQHRRRMLDAYELACILAGRSPLTGNRDTTHKGEPYEKTGIAAREVASFWVPRRGREAAPTTVEYSGIVWCPTTQNHTWVARRRGKVFYTGNCDLFDSPSGGPNLTTWAMTNFNRGRVAQLLAIALGRLNTMAQPHQQYSADGVTGVFPTGQWGPLLEQLTWVETVKHLRRSYLEQPQLEGAQVSRLDRQAYFDRWGVILADEEANVRTQLDVFKISFMGLSRPSILVSGGAYGRMSYLNRPQMAARPGIWGRAFY